MSSDRLKRNQRSIIKRLIVKGNLVLDTPTCLGSGDDEGLIDILLLRDSISSHALLTGTSIAGALRNYLHDYQNGCSENLTLEELTFRSHLDRVLFGATRQDEDGDQSPLIINDSISTKPIQSELRDGVKINSITRTAAAQAKYDLELLQAGTEFPLCFELLIEKDSNETELRKGLAIALSGLEQGEISLGMKKRRGFGRCHVKEWQVWNFNLEEDASDRMAWLTLDHSWLTDPPCTKSPAVDASIVAAMEKAGLHVPEDWEDKRDRFTINATFTLASSLLIRSGQAETGRAPDVVHLKSARIINEVKYFLASCLRQQMFSQAIAWLNLLPQEITVWTSENLELFLLAYFLLQPSRSQLPILSGTSLAGVLRHRAERIVKTLEEKPNLIIDEIFGPDFSKDKTKKPKASRLIVQESIVKNTAELVQTRIAIDRFTGGAYHGALFEEQPVFGSNQTIVTIELELRKPEDYEIGLLLLLVKDLWTSDLPVGGESSIGRGRLKGIQANLIRHHPQNPKQWKITANNENLQIEDVLNSRESEKEVKDELESFVKALLKQLGQEV